MSQSKGRLRAKEDLGFVVLKWMNCRIPSNLLQSGNPSLSHTQECGVSEGLIGFKNSRHYVYLSEVSHSIIMFLFLFVIITK